MTVTARQLCRWAAMQHPESEVVAVPNTERGLSVHLLTTDNLSDKASAKPTPVIIDGPTASAFEE